MLVKIAYLDAFTKEKIADIIINTDQITTLDDTINNYRINLSDKQSFHINENDLKKILAVWKDDIL